jgi:hypothetical protein
MGCALDQRDKFACYRPVPGIEGFARGRNDRVGSASHHPIIGIGEDEVFPLLCAGKAAEAFAEGLEAPLLGEIRQAHDPPSLPTWQPKLAAGHRPPLNPVQRRAGLEEAQALAGADQNPVALVDHLVHLGFGQPGMGEIGLALVDTEIHQREGAVLMRARDGAGAAPIGGAAVAGIDHLARMIDPDLRLGPVAQAQMQHRLLVAPLPPAIARDRAHREGTGLVVIERRNPLLALLVAPLVSLLAPMVSQSSEPRIDGEAVIEDAERKLRQGVKSLAEPAAAEGDAGDGRELEAAPGTQGMLVAAPLRGGEEPAVAGERHHFQEPPDSGAGALPDGGIGRERLQSAQAFKVDREIWRGVPLRHFPGLEVIQPTQQALASDLGLLAAAAPGTREGTVGQEGAGQVACGMEEQRVVLAEVPHHVVAGLIHPVPEAENGLVDAGAGLRADALGPPHAAPQERHEEEIRAIVEIVDRGQTCLQNPVRLRPTLTEGEAGERRGRIRLPVFRHMLQGFPCADGEVGGGFRLLVGGPDLDRKPPGRRKAAHRDSEVELAEIARQVLGIVQDEPAGSSCQGSGDPEWFDHRNRMRLDGHIDPQVCRRGLVEHDGHLTRAVGGTFETHAQQQPPDLGGAVARDRGRQGDREALALQEFEREVVAGVALAQVSEPNPEIVGACPQAYLDVHRLLEIALVTGDLSSPLTIDEKERAAAGREAKAGRLRLPALQKGLRPALDPRGAEPET